MSEKEVFIQEVSDEEMEAVAGGAGESNDDCSKELTRYIYDPSFPNCAATVERSSWCDTNDACFSDAVKYLGMQQCQRAWE